MKLKKVPTVKEIIEITESVAPAELALPGDPVGLQCGDPGSPVRRLMVALDASLDTVSQAAAFKADMLVTHHPLLYEPLTNRNIHGPAGQALARSISENLAVYSSHTNLDASPDGINAALADLLDLRSRIFLHPTGSEPLKVVVTVPSKDLEKVRLAAFEAGAGRVGDYSGCSFTVEGVGTFHAEEGANPAIGRAGRDEKVHEVRLEMTAGPQVLGAVLSGLRRAHPYEEPAVDVYPTMAHAHGSGLGIAGVLPRRSTVGQVASRLASRLKPGTARLVGKQGSRVSKVAVCAGSGASLLDAAAAAGAQLYVTGDIKYHEARKAEDTGINVLDVGHFAPEKYGLDLFGKLLERKLEERGLKVETGYAKERDPFKPMP